MTTKGETGSGKGWMCMHRVSEPVDEENVLRRVRKNV